MSLFAEPMPIDGVHDFLMNPRSTTAEEFNKLLYILGINYTLMRILNRIITDDEGNVTDLWEQLIKIDFLSSKGEIKKLIKNNGLTINKTKVKEGMVIDRSLFLESGVEMDGEELMFFVIRKGKMDCDLVFGLFSK